MIVVYFRSSLLGSWDFCQHKTYISYVLGHLEEANAKAVLGTMTHKVLELLALCKKRDQEKGKDDIVDECGLSLPHNFDIWKPSNIKMLCDASFDYYSNKSKKEFSKKDRASIEEWINIVFNHKNGAYDPRKRNIFEAEKHFDLELKKSWASYEYMLNQEKFSTNLRIKGTIDLITSVGNDTIEVIDWKGLPIETKLPTPTGFTTMGEIKIGDTVFDQYGKKCNVVGKSQVKVKDCFKITFDDKTSVVCDNEHLWKLSDGTVKPITELSINDTINIVKTLDVNNQELLTDPYNIGCHQTHTIIGKLLMVLPTINTNKVRTIVSIEPSPACETQCISVNSPDNTYLCTENFIPTHNTGASRKNWATGKIKEYEDFCKDTQLMFYYYALRQLYPNKNILFTINFIRCGGPYTLCFDDEDMVKLEKFIEQRATEMWNTNQPKLLSNKQTDFRCTRLCEYYKNNWPGTDQNMCMFVHNHIKTHGIQNTTEQLMSNGFKIGTYNAPGE